MIECILKSSEPDLTLKVSSISSRMRDVEQCSISVVVPDGVNLADEISLRIDGYLELSFDGVVFAYSAQIDSAPLYEGATSTSIQIIASGLFPAHTPADIVLKGVSYQQINVNGDLRIRASFDPMITPESTVHTETESYTVNQITYTVSDNNETMELFINA